MTVQKEILCGFLPFLLNSAKKMESVTAQVTTVKRTLRQREAASSQVSKIFYPNLHYSFPDVSPSSSYLKDSLC